MPNSNTSVLPSENTMHFMKAMSEILTYLKRKSEHDMLIWRMSEILTLIVGFITIVICECMYFSQTIDLATVMVIDAMLAYAACSIHHWLNAQYMIAKVHYHDVVNSLMNGIRVTKRMEEDFIKGEPVQVDLGNSMITIMDTKACKNP